MSQIIRITANQMSITSHVSGLLQAKRKTINANKDMENWNTCILLSGMQNGIATMKKSTEVPQSIKNRTITDPAIPLLGINPK